MSWISIVLVALPIAVIATYVITRSRKYSTLFEESTFEEFYERITEAIRTAVQTPVEPSIEDVTGFRLSADIAASVSFTQQEDGFNLHIALSQPDGPTTTHSVASRYGFFVLSILNKPLAQMKPYFTQSLVHHMVLKMESADIVFNSFAESYREYRENYKPIQFKADWG